MPPGAEEKEEEEEEEEEEEPLSSATLASSAAHTASFAKVASSSLRSRAPNGGGVGRLPFRLSLRLASLLRTVWSTSSEEESPSSFESVRAGR